MPAPRKMVVRRKKIVAHRKPMRTMRRPARPMPKMLPATTTTRIVNKVLAKNGIRPGTPMHKKLLPRLAKFAREHQKKIIAAGAVGTFAAGIAAHKYAAKPTMSLYTRAKGWTYNKLPARPKWVPSLYAPKSPKWYNARKLWTRKSALPKP